MGFENITILVLFGLNVLLSIILIYTRLKVIKLREQNTRLKAVLSQTKEGLIELNSSFYNDFVQSEKYPNVKLLPSDGLFSLKGNVIKQIAGI